MLLRELASRVEALLELLALRTTQTEVQAFYASVSITVDVYLWPIRVRQGYLLLVQGEYKGGIMKQRIRLYDVQAHKYFDVRIDAMPLRKGMRLGKADISGPLTGYYKVTKVRRIE